MLMPLYTRIEVFACPHVSKIYPGPVIRALCSRPALLRAFTISILFAVLSGSCATWVLARAISFERGRADLEVRSAQVGRFRFVYTDGGTGETILMLHGFAGDKDHWTRMAAGLTDRYRAIAPDLPGHGENDRLTDEKYTIPLQAERVHEFARQLKLGKFHLVGSSMGGAIAAYYASAYPEDLLSLALIDTAGVQSPEKSEMAIALEKGFNPLLVENEADFDRFLKFTTVKPPYIPGSIKAYFAQRAVQNRPFNEQVFRDIKGEAGSVEKRLPLIKAPTLIVWGDTDRVIHPSAAQVFARGIRGSRVVILKDCGHGPMVERPEETAAVYNAFLKDTASKKEPAP